MTIFYIVLAVIVVGIAIYFLTKKKVGPSAPQKPEGDSQVPPPPVPPQGPAM